MSQQEFDNYLELLGRLLRLDAGQREAIAEEFRAHLEDRLEELLAQGCDRERAVRLAIEEFGDAAGLAAQLAAITRNKRRRWIMRGTAITVGGLAAACLLMLAMWPDSGRLPAPRQVTAQEEATAEQVPAKTAARKQSPLETKLDKSVTVEFVDLPIHDALAFLAETGDVQFYVKQKQLEDLGVTKESFVTLSLKNVRLSTVLELMLDQLELTYVTRDELLIVTTPDDAEATMEVRVYDCRELIAQSPSSNKAHTGAFGGPGGELSGNDESYGSEEDYGLGSDSGSAAPRAKKKATSRGDGSSLPREIMPQFGGGGGMAPGAMGGMGGGEGDGYQMIYETPEGKLVQLIQMTVEPDTWEEFGGPGSMAMYNGLLAVRQSPRTHVKVERVLNMLHEAAGLAPLKVQVTK